MNAAAPRTTLSTKIIAGAFAALIGSCIMQTNSQPDRPAAAPLPPPSPAQVKAKAAFDKAETFRTTMAAGAVLNVRSAMRNPDSLRIEWLMANVDATLICLAYRAQNGFGGMAKEFVVYVDGRPSQSRAVWNKRCAGEQPSLIDEQSNVEKVIAYADNKKARGY